MILGKMWQVGSGGSQSMRADWVNFSCVSLGLVVFALLAWQVRDNDSRVWELDRNLASEAQVHAQENPEILSAARDITDAGGVPVMTALAIVGALLLWLCGQPKLAVFWLVAACLGAVINIGSKSGVDRPRPGESLRDSAVHERNASFPSGHAMGSTIGYGSLAIVGAVLLRRRWATILLTLLLTLLVVTICWSRVYLRAHWCSDVIAGVAIGSAWLALCSMIMGTRGRANSITC
ncbi:MAG: phosphatase PAP2 family protein [Longimicrobiales bacterium]